MSIETSSVPEVALVPVQLLDPDAVQDVALVVDQEKVEVLFRRTEVGVAEKLIPGAGVGGVGASPPPPPPPPPQAVIIKSTASKEIRFMCLNLT
jgi:hypothetical protein